MASRDGNDGHDGQDREDAQAGKGRVDSKSGKSSNSGKSSQTGNEGHRQRLRARMDNDSVSLPDYEFLELLLTYVLKRRDTKPLAKELLKKFDSLRGVLDARPGELLEIDGFGKSLVFFWQVLRELIARYGVAEACQREALASPEAVARLARQRLAGCDHEECWLALLDNGNHLISWQRLQMGSVSVVGLEPRDIFAAALAKKASGIILVHNHPGGSLKPSQADQEFTNTLCQLAPALGTRFLDHLIVTDSGCFSILQKQPL